MARIIEILQKEYGRLEYAMKLGKSIGKENAPEYKQLEIELKETGEAIKILRTNADTGEKQCNLPVVVCSTWLFFYEGEKDKPQFKVQANTQWEAYQIAAETYGPQVEDMMYCMI